MDPARPTSEEQPFFAASQWGCFLFLGVLALAAATSAMRIFSGGPATTYEGVLGTVEFQQASPWQISYHVVVAADGSQAVPLQLRNQGTILGYLRTRAQPIQARVTARGRVALALTDLDSDSTIAEPEAPQALLLAAAILPLPLLALLVYPWLVGRRTMPGSPAIPARTSEEEE
jgi:hypothetical protein